jgi:hypothetical protein
MLKGTSCTHRHNPMKTTLHIIALLFIPFITSCSSSYSVLQREYAGRDFRSLTIGTAAELKSFSVIDTKRNEIPAGRKVSIDTAMEKFQAVLENEIMVETKFGAAVPMSIESSGLLCQENASPDPAVPLNSINGMEPAFSLSFQKVKIVVSEYWTSKTSIFAMGPIVFAITTAAAMANLEKYQKTEIDADYRIWDVSKRRVIKSGSEYVSCAVPAAEIHGGGINLTDGLVKELVEKIFDSTPFNLSKTTNKKEEY